MLPIIGITSGKEHSDTGLQKICLIDQYVHAILESGGLPFIIPPDISPQSVDAIMDHVDGILITGGGDIETKRFNGQDHPRVYGVDTNRDNLEIAIVNAAVSNPKPILGICRGVQIMNVALGGDLFTDIEDQKKDALKHDWFPGYPRDRISHAVEIRSGSLLNKIFDISSVEVNSLHHQAIRNLSTALTATAFAPDGLIEAVEIGSHPFFVGVQWHPEWLFSSETTQKLFKTFINATME
ncbi:MAG: gamma-glutamyl-gamma-aminobutyrate hydrolase family protein [Anaerolineaceae bacterium]|jgi:putative glutamine amidotransferase|nr:gamma-glutamyl-gamma-aminobutyrate hydrolase family protein [Anaerolineaceae bacterium]